MLCTATAVIAASIALPPSRNMSIAASVAEGLDVAAIPCSAMAADRVGILKSRILAPSSWDGPPQLGLVTSPVSLASLTSAVIIDEALSHVGVPDCQECFSLWRYGQMHPGLQWCPHGHAGSIVRLLLTAMILFRRKARVLAMGCL